MAGTSDIRNAAQSLYSNMNPYRNYGGIGGAYHIDMMHRGHSINFISEDFIAGYMHDGRMSVVRRFFCLFVTFDMFLVSLLWLLCIMITGDNIYNALKIQVIHYTIYTSLFDIVMAAICRFIVLLLFYALLYINHWSIIAMSTTFSCAFLISKVFVYDWANTPQPVLQVVLIVTSFVLAWGEAWFLDCRVIPQEQHAISYVRAVQGVPDDRSPLLAPYLASSSVQPESVGNFYSPYESIHNSDDDEDEMDEYKKMGIECVRRSFKILVEEADWKIEKVNNKTGDTIKSINKKGIGKIYRLTGRIHYPAKLLLHDLFYNVEKMAKWNPSIIESRIIKSIDYHTDISYQATVGGGGGIVKKRDFVNLRSWHLCRNNDVVLPADDATVDRFNFDWPVESQDYSSVEGSVSSISERKDLRKTSSENNLDNQSSSSSSVERTAGTKSLSKSLGGNCFEDVPPIDDEDNDTFVDTKETLVPETVAKPINKSEDVYVSAAVGIEYKSVPEKPNYIRGKSLVSCWAMKEIHGKPDYCIFEWLLCLDLKGYIPKYVLEATYTSLMQDYMVHIREHCKELRDSKSA